MNPLNSILGTIVSGFIAAALAWLVLHTPAGDTLVKFNLWSLAVWFHVLAGITWIGLLYYFNFVQTPAMAQATADGTPGPAAISKYVAPRALLWFRWSAVVTWLTGAMALEAMHAGPGSGVTAAFTFVEGWRIIGLGAWLGTIMLFNVWVLIWPNQKKILGIVPATDAQKATARKVAAMASRTNVLLSIPMLLCMTSQFHGLPF
ncbi:MAG: urate hydroxylase PuuD [Gammaproteobacteria bacterium]|nr:urate hydroxylase PuuD [Gammaproteobacteria bacterium]